MPANVEIFRLPLKELPEGTDRMYKQATAGGATESIPLSGLTDLLGSDIVGLYSDTLTVASEATGTVADFVDAGEPARGLMFIQDDDTSGTTFCVLDIAGSTIFDVDLGSQYNNGGTTNPDVAGETNVWLDTTPNPPQVKIKNRNAYSNDYTVWTFTYSTNGG